MVLFIRKDICSFVRETGLDIIKNKQIMISEMNFPVQGLNLPSYFFEVFALNFSMLEFSVR